jgi:alpha-tubulin suppressor-like RCC1 family protein
VAVGYEHTCARGSANQVYCWGANQFGQIVPGGTIQTYAMPTGVNVAASRQIAVGQFHTCSASTGLVTCFGKDDFGQLGNGQAGGPGPVNVSVANATTVSAGLGHSCTLDQTSTLFCWGDNFGGEIGGTPTGPSAWFIAPRTLPNGPGTLTVTAYDLGGEVTCSVFSDKSVKCVGRNDFGQLGIGFVDASAHNAYQPVQGLQNASKVAVGGNHSCAIAGPDAALFCWGFNGAGQVGVGKPPSAYDAQAVEVVAQHVIAP